MLRSFARLLSVTLAIALPLSATAGDGFSVRAVGTFERRWRSYSQSAADRYRLSTPVDLPPLRTLTVTAEFLCPTGITVARYRGVKMVATDGSGQALQQRHTGTDRDPDSLWIRATKDQTGKRSAMELSFDSPPRRVARIASIAGTVTVLAGRPTDLFFADFYHSVGRQLDSPELKNASVTLAIGAFAANSGARIDVRGDVEAIDRIEVVGADGAPISPPMAFHAAETSTSYPLQWPGPLPSGAKLHVVLIADARVIDVPIDLKGIPLP